MGSGLVVVYSCCCRCWGNRMLLNNRIMGTKSFLSGSCAVTAIALLISACGTGQFTGSNQIAKKPAEETASNPGTGSEPFPGADPATTPGNTPGIPPGTNPESSPIIPPIGPVNPHDSFDPKVPFDPTNPNGFNNPNNPYYPAGPDGPVAKPGSNPSFPTTIPGPTPGSELPWIPASVNPSGKTPPVWGTPIEIFKPVVGPGLPPGAPIIVNPSKPGAPAIVDFNPGAGRLFHIGDNAMENSTCLGMLRVTPLSGTEFYFEFEVTDGAANVQIAIKDVCGVDYDTNSIRLIREGGAVIREGVIPRGVGPLGRATVDLGMQNLQPGKYQIRVESVRNPMKVFRQTPEGDRDDFIIGNVMVHSDRPIAKIGYRAN